MIQDSKPAGGSQPPPIKLRKVDETQPPVTLRKLDETQPPVTLRKLDETLPPLAAAAPNFAEMLPQSQAVLRRIAPGTTIGRYQLGARLGIGGMGVVHRADDLETGQPVAIKFLISSSQEDSAARIRRFEEEARIIRKLDHQAIVSVKDFASSDDLHYLVMELFLGPYDQPVNLNDYAASFGAANGMLDEADTRAIILCLLDAIGYAHANGVIHCDLKPANILFQSLGWSGDHWRAHLKLTDFGVARVVGEAAVHQSVTQSLNRLSAGEALANDGLALLGTYDYMSPEQRRGQPATVASDLYAIGLMVYRFLTGQSELGLRKPSELRRGLSRGWDTVILKALQEEPGQRYSSASEMAAAIEGLGR